MNNRDEIETHLSRIKLLMSAEKTEENQDTPEENEELRTLVGSLSPVFIARILEELSTQEQQILWHFVSDLKKDEILLEVEDSVRVDLLFEVTPQIQSTKVRVFDLFEGRLRQIPIENREVLAKTTPIWIDLVMPEDEELAWAGELFGVKLPDPRNLTDLESSARFYVEDNGEVHLHSDFLLDREDESRNVMVAFILKGGILFSIRNEELPVFRLQRLRARAKAGYVSEAKDVLLDLYAADVEYSANALEDVYSELEAVGRQVYGTNMTDEESANILSAIAEEEDLNGRIRRNVRDTRRALSFLMRGKFLSEMQYEDVREILRDIESLDGHTAFLFNKINFLMDAIVGFININQNKVIKQLTIISIIFMPLNFLAGVGGMSEYSMMTHGIPWPVSYLIFTIAMILLGWITYIILRYFGNRKLTSSPLSVRKS
ncbi:MAG: magnesium and cobalt transport protein CorA [Desulfuromonadaceae bacterium]|nr:magnesium and cobalt transport protein CorA [Desulfuromonadaceae bacterium]MDD2856545.1 magnesium and cobalt transport protein CorA [Desulfuromonadaceae bacterium]